jgi:hypothetical protein
VKRFCRGGPSETPDSNGSRRARSGRYAGRVANTKDMATIDDGIASAKKP